MPDPAIPARFLALLGIAWVAWLLRPRRPLAQLARTRAGRALLALVRTLTRSLCSLSRRTATMKTPNPLLALLCLVTATTPAAPAASTPDAGPRVRVAPDVRAFVDRVRHAVEGVMLRRTHRRQPQPFPRVERLLLIHAGYLPAQPEDAPLLDALKEALAREVPAMREEPHA